MQAEPQMSHTCYYAQYVEENTQTDICPLSINVRAEKAPGLLGQAHEPPAWLVLSLVLIHES